MVAVTTLVNYFGIETTARTSFVLLAFQLALLALLAVLGGIAVAHHVAGASVSFAPFYNPALVTPGLIFGALSLAVLSFLGFDAISTLSEESLHGAPAIGRATMVSLCLSAALFIGQTYIASLFVLGRTNFPSGTATDGAYYSIAALIGGPAFKFLLAVPGILLSSLAGAITAQAATARLLFGMARDGELPRALAYVEPKRKVPERTVFLVAGVTLVTGLLLADQLELLTSMVNFGALFGFLLLQVSVFVHFVVRNGSRNWLRHAVIPAIGFLILMYVLWNAEANAKIAGISWLAVGLAVFAGLALQRRTATR
jgi:amino acid transporter